MPEGYAKLLTSILDSSIWAEPDDVVRVWVTLLAMADRDGYVGAAPSGIAHRSRTVSVTRVNELLKKFQEPDPESRSKDFDGRRIQKVDRGFLLLNYKKIRDMHADGAERTRKRLWWEANKAKKPVSQTELPLDASTASETLVNGSVAAHDSDFDLKDSDLGSDTRGRRRKKSPIDPPENFIANEATVRCAEKHKRDWRADWEECRDWHLKQGTSICDWQAALRTWMSKANAYAKPKPKTECPDKIEFTERQRGLCKRSSIDINLNWCRFRDNCRSKAITYADWSSAFSAELARAVEYYERNATIKNNGSPQRDAVAGSRTAEPKAQASLDLSAAKSVPESRPGTSMALIKNIG